MTDEHRTSGAGKPRPYSIGTDAFTRTAGGKLEGDLGPVKAGVEAYRRSWDETTFTAGSGYAPQAPLPGVETDSIGAYAKASFPLSRTLDLDTGSASTAGHLSYQRDPFRNGVKVTEPGRNLYVNVAYRY